jgi:hypothetical protein
MTMTSMVTMPFCCKRGSKKWAHNVIAMDFAGALSPDLAQAGYLYPNTPMAVELVPPLLQPHGMTF